MPTVLPRQVARTHVAVVPANEKVPVASMQTVRLSRTRLSALVHPMHEEILNWNVSTLNVWTMETVLPRRPVWMPSALIPAHCQMLVVPTHVALCRIIWDFVPASRAVPEMPNRVAYPCSTASRTDSVRRAASVPTASAPHSAAAIATVFRSSCACRVSARAPASRTRPARSSSSARTTSAPRNWSAASTETVARMRPACWMPMDVLAVNLSV